MYSLSLKLVAKNIIAARDVRETFSLNPHTNLLVNQRYLINLCSLSLSVYSLALCNQIGLQYFVAKPLISIVVPPILQYCNYMALSQLQIWFLVVHWSSQSSLIHLYNSLFITNFLVLSFFDNFNLVQRS
jgi:hypothetical protein